MCCWKSEFHFSVLPLLRFNRYKRALWTYSFLAWNSYLNFYAQVWNSTTDIAIKVNNLVEGRAYKFLVRAVNQIGDSPDLETENEVIAKNPFDPPSAVGKPNVPDWGEDFAEVAWKPSEDDGGADISGYRVEVRNRDRRAWNVAGTAGGSESRY